MKRFYPVFFILFITLPALVLADPWVVSTDDDWKAAKGYAENLKIAEGCAKPTAEQGSFKSIIKTFPEKRKLSSATFEQSPVWDNWEQIEDITPPGLGNAYVFLPVAPGNYYVFATYKGNKPKLEYPDGLDRKQRREYKKEWQKKTPQPARLSCLAQ